MRSWLPLRCSIRKGEAVRLRHMLDAAQEALSFTKGKTRHDLDHDRMLALSLVRLIEVIGEAAAQVTKDTQSRLSSIQWPTIIAMRHRLIHAYFDIDLDVVWDTVANDLPPLMNQLKQVLATAAFDD